MEEEEEVEEEAAWAPTQEEEEFTGKDECPTAVHSTHYSLHKM